MDDNGGGAIVDVAYRWPRRKIGVTPAGISRSMTSILLREADEVDAPVAYLLSAPGGDIPIRRLSGYLFRPLLAPGEWRPIRVDEFAEAMRTGLPWCDSPVCGRRAPAYNWGGSRSLITLADYAAKMEPENRRGESARGEAERAVSTLAGCFVAMNGTVYFQVDDTRLHVLHDDPFGGIPSISWMSAGLWPQESQQTLVKYEGFIRAGGLGDFSFPVGDVEFVEDLVGLLQKRVNVSDS